MVKKEITVRCPFCNSENVSSIIKPKSEFILIKTGIYNFVVIMLRIVILNMVNDFQ